MRAAFSVFDKDGNGSIDKSELTYVLTNIGSEKLSDSQIDEIFNKVDTNGDGVISYAGKGDGIINFVDKEAASY